MMQSSRTFAPHGASRAAGSGGAASIAIIAAVLLMISPRAAHSDDLSAQSQTFNGCGTVVIDPLYYCYLFQADDNGLIYAVDGLHEYYPGDRLHIQGKKEPGVSFCTIDGIIFDATITWCDEDDECPADLDGNGAVDVFDLLVLLSQWGPCGYSCSADLDGDGVVDVFDLLALLGAWGPCPG